MKLSLGLGAQRTFAGSQASWEVDADLGLKVRRPAGAVGVENRTLDRPQANRRRRTNSVPSKFDVRT